MGVAILLCTELLILRVDHQLAVDPPLKSAVYFVDITRIQQPLMDLPDVRLDRSTHTGELIEPN